MSTDIQTDEFKHIVDTWYQAIFRFAYSLSKSDHNAADITQDTFHLLAKNFSKIKDLSKVKSWLFTTAFREFLKAKKKSQRMTTVENDAIITNKATQTKVFSNFRKNYVIKALEKLNEKYRGPITLYYIKDCSYKEISEILDIPIGTVMSRISRGKDQFKKILTEVKEELR